VPNPVNTADIKARWRPLTAEEEAVAQAYLDDAWAVVLSQVPGIEARITAGSLSLDLVVKVVAAMVLRIMRNPDGIRQWQIDDASFTRDQALSAGLLYLADSERAELMPRASSYGSGAYFISFGG
jgi:hypothetical protein